MSLDQYVQDLYDAGRQVEQTAQDHDEAVRVRDDAIRAALTAGVPVKIIVDASGLSRARVYQVRDGRR